MLNGFRKVRAAIFASAFVFVASTPTLSADAWQSEVLRDHPLVGKIYDVSSASFISRKDLLGLISTSRHVLLGEIHDNADHHALQAEIIEALAEQKRRPRVVMEMLEKAPPTLIDSQNAIERKDSSHTSHVIDNFRRWWTKSGWPDFEIYAPIFTKTLASGLRLATSNMQGTSSTTIETLLTTAALSRLHEEALNEELEISHCGVLPDNVIPKIAVAQRKRDIKLALAMRAAHATGGDGTVLIAGSGHARKDRGVPHYLEHFGESSATINFREVTEGKTEPLDLIEPGEADYIWFTPRRKREDPCIALRKRFGKTKAN